MSAANLDLTLVAERHADRIDTLLAQAKALTLPTFERVSATFKRVAEEASFAQMMSTSSLVPHPDVPAAQQGLREATERMESSCKAADAARAAHIAALHDRPPWWRRLLDRVTGQGNARAKRLSALKIDWETAWANSEVDQRRRVGASWILAKAERQHSDAEAAFRLDWASKAADLREKQAAAEVALDFCKHLPGLFHAGEAGLLTLGRRIIRAREARCAEDPDMISARAPGTR